MQHIDSLSLSLPSASLSLSLKIKRHLDFANRNDVCLYLHAVRSNHPFISGLSRHWQSQSCLLVIGSHGTDVNSRYEHQSQSGTWSEQ